MISQREYILKFKQNRKCKKCGWNKHPEILQFHHKNKKDKNFDITVKCGNRVLKENFLKEILKEIEKCDLLCPNCHMWLHFK